MDRVQSWLFLLLAGVAGVTYLWLSAKNKRSPALRSQTQAVQERSNDELPLETGENRARPPLEVLYPGTNDDAEVDIIAVHGLGSNVDWSWTWKDGEKRINWLRDPDMLPARVPKSRIIVYNYESRWHADAPKTRLQLCGEELVQNLHSFRSDTPTRPFIFVGHSLGGNVIVHALLHASDEKRYRYLLEATAGVVFLGTPLRGTKWQLFLDSLAQLMSPAGSHREITKELEFDGPELRDRLNRFCRLRNELSTPVSCFFELYETDYGRRFGLQRLAKGMIVEEASACVPGFDRYGLQTDHLKINKYRGPDDRGFQSVSNVILEMCENANNVVTRRHNQKEPILDSNHARRERPEAIKCLRDLFLTDPHEDRNALKRKKGDRARGTCDWIMGTEELTTWLGSTQTDYSEGQATQVLWLYGNPGTGKSTMAIFLTEELSKVFSKTDDKTLAYFFCDSAFEKRKTATAVVRGLLLQLVQQHPQLLTYLLPKHDERGAELFNSFDALWKIFLDVAADNNTGQKYCIIDALDECDSESQTTLLQQLRETFLNRNAHPNVHLLVTSRPYDEISEHMEKFAKKNLASYCEAKQDIERCIEERTAELTERKRYTGKVRTQVGDILREKAEGTFLWVGLACKELEGIPSKDAVRELQNMPKGLHSLYEKLLETAVKDPRANHVQRLLKYVAVFVRPLSVLELSEACQLHLNEDEDTRTQFTREQIASCRLMVVIQDDKVLLLHKSVKDFLVKARFVDDLEAHADLACRCVDLLTKDFHEKKEPRVPFLDYASTEWANHARMAQSKFEVQASYAEFFDIESDCRESWLILYRNLKPERGVPGNFSILHVAAWWGIPALVDHACRQADAKAVMRLISSADDRGVTPLEYAARRGETEVISLLMYPGVNVSEPVLKAAAGNYGKGKEVMELLLDRRGDQIIITEEVVKAAAGNTYNGEEVMALLLNRRGDQVIITEEVAKAAAGNEENGEEVMALLLDQRGDQVIITEEVVKAAAGNTYNGEEVMALLLDRRGDQVIITEEVVKAAVGNTYNGEEVMALLLNRRGDQVIITEEVVKAAAGNYGNGKEVMALLLNRRGDQVIITEEVVKAAVGNTYNGEEVMALLLDRRGDQVIITEGVACTIANGFPREVMELLLDRRGDQVIITEEVVKAAARNRENGKEVMELLLDRRGDQVIMTEGVACTIANGFPKEVMKLLLDRQGDQVIITEEVAKAAAGNYGNGKEVMELLLDRRGDQVIITEEVAKAAAGNYGNGKEVMALLLDRRGDQITITEEVVKAAAGNWYKGKEVMALLLDRRGDQVIITEEVAKAAAGNEENGEEVMALLLDQRGDQVIITEEVVKAAVGNTYNGEEVMALLLNRRGDQVIITEEVVKAAAGNEENGKEVMALLLDQRGDQITITEEVVKAAATCGQDQVLNFLSQQTVCIEEEWRSIAQFYNAAKFGDVRAIEQLIQKGVKPDMKNIRSETPLWIAAYFGHDTVVELLAQRKDVDVNSRSVSGGPPVFWSASYGYESIVAALIDAGANPTFVDCDGNTAITMARKSGYERIADDGGME